MSKYTLYDYDSSKFPFKETVQSMMDVDQLDMIHEVFEFPEKLEIIKDQNFGLDYEKCVADKKVEDHILEDRIEGAKKFEINATPTIIINDKKFEKTLNFKNLKKAIEKLI